MLLAEAHIQHDKQFVCQHTKSSDAGEADLFFTAAAHSGQIIQIAEPEKAFDLGKLGLGSAVLMSIHYLKYRSQRREILEQSENTEVSGKKHNYLPFRIRVLSY